MKKRHILGGFLVGGLALAGFNHYGRSNPSEPIFVDGAPIILEAIQHKRLLVTASQPGHKIVEAEMPRNQYIPAFLNEDKILLEAYGLVTAGFDFSMSTGVHRGDSYVVSIGAPRIIMTKLDNKLTHPINRHVGLAVPANLNLESKVRAKAEAEILQVVCQGNILEEARQEGEAFVKDSYAQAGITNVVVISEPGNCA